MDEIIIEKRESDLNEIQLEINENILIPNTEEITITPSQREQIREGLFNKVTVNAVDGEELIIAPTTNEQIREGLFDKVVVNAIPNSEIISKDIDFVDYDGTLLYSYTFEEIKNITELPPLPAHPGLVCQEWNWSLEDIKNREKELIVGATYITDDDKTRIYIELRDEQELDMSFLFRQTKTNGVEVDWGDGSPIETFESKFSTNDILAKHNYNAVGNYIITFNSINGCTFSFGRGNSYSNCTGYGDSAGASSKMHYCANMIKKINLGKNFTFSNGAFAWCRNLQTITIPKEAANIASEIFKECYALKAIIIPNGCKTIDNLFKYCENLECVSFPNYIETVTSNIFLYCLNLKRVIFPESIIKMGSLIFSNCLSLKKVVMPKNLNTLGSSVFSCCYSLEEINIPEGLTTLESQFISNCFLLKEIQIPNNIINIKSTFRDCENFKEIIIPDSVTTLPTHAFYNCSKLERVKLPKNLDVIKNYTFYNCYSLQYVEIPTSITAIDTSAFDGCFSLIKIEVPENVTTLGDRVFYECRSLRQAILPSSLTSIGDSAFYNCHSLKEIFIPKNVMELKGQIFLNCYNLQKMDFSTHTQIPVVSSSSAFASVPKTCQIIVPDDLYDDWIAATNWSKMASCIIKASEVM